MAMIKEYWADNQGIRINYIDNEIKNQLTPLVFIPGMLSTAQDYMEDFKVMAPRRCVALSLRGRGKSDTPASGYTIEDHASDINAVICRTTLDHFAMFAFSMGVPYAIEYATKHKESIVGLILGDFPALTRRMPEAWISDVIRHYGKDKEQLATAVQRESKDLELWNKMHVFDFPVLVLYGCKEGSLMNDQYVELYKKHLEKIELIAFEESGHQIWKPDYDRLMKIMKRFMDECDKK